MATARYGPRHSPLLPSSRRGFWQFCRVVPAASSSSRAIARRRAGHAPSPSTRPCSAAPRCGCQGIPGPFRCPPVPLSLPFPFRCPIRCPFDNNNSGNAVIMRALRHPHVPAAMENHRAGWGGLVAGTFFLRFDPSLAIR